MQQDLAAGVIAAGSAAAFLSQQIRDTSALRQIRALSEQCDAQRSIAHSASSAALDPQTALQTAAQSALSDARDRLDEIKHRSQSAISDHKARTEKLANLLTTFETLTKASKQFAAVATCRKIADAYIKALRPLALHQRHGSVADIDTVAAHIDALIHHVDAVRRKGTRCLFADHPQTNQRIIASIENRAVDAVIKARAAFVNVLDNHFRKFGWPMNVPQPDKDDDVIQSVNFYVRQLAYLQKVASEGDYIPQRTKWHSALSDSWAIAAILRAPLARFKYHFLETFRLDEQNDSQSASTTSRFDRPEWAAEFALNRIQEATPFLAKVAIDGPVTADVKFAEGFCTVFADKIAYDCELALRTSTNDADADVLIAHASGIAKQFDAKLRSGVIQVDNRSSVDPSAEPSFLSSLHLLSLNEWFLTTWASSELRLAEAEVNKLLSTILSASDDPQAVLSLSRNDLETLCQEIVNNVGAASYKCRSLESQDRLSTFLKLTELPLLRMVRSLLKDEVQIDDIAAPTAVQVEKAARSSFCAQLIADALDDRSCDAFYVHLEKSTGTSFYQEEIDRLRGFHSTTCQILAEAIARIFADDVRMNFMDQVHFGEITAPNAAIVLTHDLSEPLVGSLTALESSLTAVSKAIPSRKTASAIWRPVAETLDRFFFDEIILQSFAGGSRNAMAAASVSNNYLTPGSAARMARQLAHDAEMFVSTFSAVTAKPKQFIPLCSDCGTILRIGSSKVLSPMVPTKQEHGEVLNALEAVSQSSDEEVVKTARLAMRSKLGLEYLTPREALELLAICGLKFAIPFM